MRIVCGMTAGAADSKISNQPVTFESNRIESKASDSNSNRISNIRRSLTFMSPSENFFSPSLKKIVVLGDTENFTSWLHPQFS